MIKEKTFYKSFMVLALSLALQNLLTYGVNLMDTMMLGRYSQDAMGGVSPVSYTHLDVYKRQTVSSRFRPFQRSHSRT